MKVFIAIGTLASWSGSAAVIAFSAVALLLLLRQPVRRPISLAHVIWGTTGIFTLAAVGYTFTWPNEIRDVHVWLGPFLAIAGAACLATSGVLIHRWIEAVHASAPPLPAPSVDISPVPVPQPALYAPVPVPTLGLTVPSPFAPPGGSVAQPLPFAPPPPPPLMIPPCPSCATPMLWVSAKSSYVCTICRTRNEPTNG
jgi:hypothetical protein